MGFKLLYTGKREEEEEEVGLHNLNASRSWNVRLAEGDQTVRKVFATCGSGCAGVRAIYVQYLVWVNIWSGPPLLRTDIGRWQNVHAIALREVALDRNGTSL
jgi:hypothetical protein